MPLGGVDGVVSWSPSGSSRGDDGHEVLVLANRGRMKCSRFLSNIRPAVGCKDLLEDSDTHPMNVYGTKVCIFKKNPDL